MLAKHLDSISKSIIDSGIESVDMLVEPDAVSFNSALYGWSRSHAFHSDVAASRAVELLDFQQALADVTQNAKSAPDTQSFTIAILAQRGASTSTRAGLKISLEIFQRWLATIEMRSPIRPEHEPDGNASDGPKQQEDLLIHPFSALLSLIYNIPSSVDKQSPKRGRGENLQHDSMRQLFEFSGEEKDNGTEDFSKPDLDLIAEKSDLYEVALQVYQAGVNDSLKLGAHLQPNHHFYSAFLSCLEKHCHPTSVELKTMTEQVWLDARESGQVSRIVWPKILNLCRHLDGGLYRLLGDDVEHFTQEEMSLYTSRRNRNNKNPRRERARARVSNLPRYWWRNVPPSWK
uniref:Uncharacterized protein n=1 Tax=Entomoneis paludosa TaxID=265537 RepID=A0A7S2YHU3_9STRA|mmetsp:Transcript_33284/g.69331  ORF Transcript_33284/g.69331 Transcript_33284/m.69331 type:complete len:346 (+) Transcript_33284:1-1038(+)